MWLESQENSTNVTAHLINNSTAINEEWMKVADLHQIINALFCVLSLSAFTLNTVILFVFTHVNNFTLNIPVGIGIFFFSSVVTIVADLSYKSSEHPESGHFQFTEDVQYNIYNTMLQFIFGIVMFIYFSMTLFSIPNRSRDALGYHHENIGLIIWFITAPLALLELLLFLDKCLHPGYVYAVLVIVSMLQKVIQAGFYYFSVRLQVPKPGKTRAASWFLKIIALLNFSMWLQSIMVSDKSTEYNLAELFNIPNNKLDEPLSIIACAYSALIIDYRLLCCLLFLEHALEIDCARPGEHLRPFTPQPSQVEEHIGNELHLSAWRCKGLGYGVGLLIIILTCINGVQYFTQIGPWTDSFSFVIELLVIFLGFAMVKQLPNQSSTFPSWRETSSIGIDVMVAMMGLFGVAFWILKGSIIAIWSVQVPNEHLEMEFQKEGLMHLRPEYLVWQGIKCFVRAIGVAFQVYFFVNINSSYGRRSDVIRNRWNFFYVPVMTVSLFAIFINSVMDEYGGIVEHSVKRAGLCAIVSALYHAGGPIHLGFCIHLFLHFMIIKQRMDKAVEQLREATSHRRRNTRRLLTSVLEEPTRRRAENSDEEDDDDDNPKYLMRRGRKNFFRTH